MFEDFISLFDTIPVRKARKIAAPLEWWPKYQPRSTVEQVPLSVGPPRRAKSPVTAQQIAEEENGNYIYLKNYNSIQGSKYLFNIINIYLL